MSEDGALSSLGKDLSGVGGRWFPYRKEEEKEELAQGGIE